MTSWLQKPIPGGWEYQHEDSSASVVLDYITPKGTSWEAWVECRVPDRDLPVASGTVNIASPSAARPFLQMIGDDPDVPWKAGLQTAFYQTVDAERNRSTVIDLALVEGEPVTFLIEPLVEMGGNTRLIAPGGSGKSFLSLAMTLTVCTGSRKFLGLSTEQQGPVLYLDWETNKETHARRRDMLCAGAGVPPPGPGLLFYQQEALPLFRSMQRIARFVEREGVVMLVVDSRQTAAGASGQSSGEEAALNLHSALRAIDRPALLVDHKAKENIAKGRKGGYGSVWNTNLARMEWEFTKYQRIGDGQHVFSMSLEKGNNVGRLPDVAYRLDILADQASFTRMRPETVVDPAMADSLAERIVDMFTAAPEPMTVPQIAELAQVSANSVRSALKRDNRFVNLSAGKGKKGLWRLSDDFTPDEGVQQQLEEYEAASPVGVNGKVADDVDVW